MARTSVNVTNPPQICKCCGQYINPPRRRAPRRQESRTSKKFPTDRFLPLGSPSNNAEDFHWEFGVSNVSLKDAYLSVRGDSAFADPGLYESLWDSLLYFVFTVEHQGARDAALQCMLRCNADSRAIKPNSVGCLIVSDTEYLFFWRKDASYAGI